MKKILCTLAVLFSMLIFNQNVNASSFNANIVGNDTFEDEITLYIQVNNLTDFTGACNGLCGLVGELSYDTEKLDLTSISAMEGFDLTNGKTIVLYKSTGVVSGTNILSMKFKNKSLTKDETTTITFSNVVASDGDKDINTSDASKVIKFIVKEVESNTTNNTNNTNNTNTNSNNNANTNINTNTNKKEEKDNLKEETEKSSNSYLSSITLSTGSIKFDKDTLTYDVIVDYETTSINIKTTTLDDKATVTGDGKHSLNVGSNVIEITVQAEDESKRTYTLNVSREKENIVVKDGDNVVTKENKEEEKNYILPIIITVVILGVGIVLVVWKNRKNK